MAVLLRLICEDCGCDFAAWSHIAYLANPLTKESIKCDCGSRNIKEIEALQVG